MTEPSSSPTRTVLWAFSRGVPYGEVPDWVGERLSASFPELRVVVTSDGETILREVAAAEIFISWAMKPEQFALAKKLRWIHSPAAGVTQLLFPAVVASNVIVTNSTTVHSIPVAEQTVALLFALARRLRDAADDQARRHWGQIESWNPERIPTELNGKTLGLVGLGAIGREVAARAKALGMTVEAVKRDASRGAEHADRVYAPEQLHTLLERSDYLVLAIPGNPETRHIIGANELARMKPSAVIVNVARGTLLDTDALVRALEAGKLAGAGLDVTDPEPLPAEHPLWRLRNVIITPHLAGATDRYWQRQADMVSANLRRYLDGEPLLNLVDKKRGY
jgi:phosphoglycerate dehydrogenase-like enzyme